MLTLFKDDPSLDQCFYISSSLQTQESTIHHDWVNWVDWGNSGHCFSMGADTAGSAHNSLLSPTSIPNSATFTPRGTLPASSCLPIPDGFGILAELLTARENPFRGAARLELESLMRVSSLEGCSEELSAMSQPLLEISNPGLLHRLFQFVLYLISNNLLSDWQMDCFLKWLMRQKHDKVMMSYLLVRTPTVDAFAPKILESSVRIRDARLLRLLIDLGVDTGPLKGVRGGRLLQDVICSRLLHDPAPSTEVALIMIESGADVNVPVCKQHPYPTLQIAAAWGGVRLVEALLRAGSHVNSRAFLNNNLNAPNALSAALYRKNSLLIHILINSGADVKNCRVNGQNGHEWAKIHADDNIVRILSRASRMETPEISLAGVLRAARLGSQELSEYLSQGLRGIDIGTNDIVGAALHAVTSKIQNSNTCSHTYDRTAVSSLLEAGDNPNVTRKGCSALRMAVRRGDIGIVEMLLDRGADVNSAIVLAAVDFRDGRLDLLRLLLDEAADVNGDEGAALRLAAVANNVGAVKLLLAHGADVNDPCSDHVDDVTYSPALHWGVGNVETVRILLQAGADVNAPTDSKGFDDGPFFMTGGSEEAIWHQLMNCYRLVQMSIPQWVGLRRFRRLPWKAIQQ